MTPAVERTVPMRARLMDLWCEVLDVEETDIENDPHFFDLGGDSVAAIRLVRAASDRGLALDNITVFEHPELEAMASLCREAEPKASDTRRDSLTGPWDEALICACEKACGVDRAQIEDIDTCTVQQDFVMKSYLKHRTYHNQMVFHFSGDEALLRESWICIEQRNPILRTRLVQHGDKIVHVVVKGHSEWDQGSNLADYKLLNGKRIMGYGTPLVRFAIISEEHEKFLVWTYLQVVVDGWTKKLIFRDLAESFGNPDEFKSKAILRPPFKSFIEHINSIDQVAAMAFWDQRLNGLKNIDILHSSDTNHEPVSHESSRIVEEIPFSHRTSPKNASRSVNPATSSSSITYSTIAHVAWALTIRKISGLKDVFFVSKRSGRQCALASAESIMGPLIAHTPCRIKLDSTETIQNLLIRTQSDMLEAIPWEPYGWRVLLDRFGPARYCQSLLIPQAPETDVFARDIVSIGDGEKREVLLSPDEGLSTMQNMALGILIELRPRSEGKLQVVTEFDKGLISEVRMRRILRIYARMLQDVAAVSQKWRSTTKTLTVKMVLS
ncbi:MAG: hypothetical protein Q9195_007375 [Heterodermia aff. obscurata]